MNARFDIDQLWYYLSFLSSTDLPSIGHTFIFGNLQYKSNNLKKNFQAIAQAKLMTTESWVQTNSMFILRESHIAYKTLQLFLLASVAPVFSFGSWDWSQDQWIIFTIIFFLPFRLSRGLALTLLVSLLPLIC